MIAATVFEGVAVFTATRASERAGLGQAVTSWLDAHPTVEVVDKVVTQSSDSEFHCLTITLFYRARLRRRGKR